MVRNIIPYVILLLRLRYFVLVVDIIMVFTTAVVSLYNNYKDLSLHSHFSSNKTKDKPKR